MDQTTHIGLNYIVRITLPFKDCSLFTMDMFPIQTGSLGGKFYEIFNYHITPLDI